MAAVLTGIQAVLFAIGAGLGVHRTPTGVLFRRLVRPRLAPPDHLEDPAPPRFAQAVGLVFAVVATHLSACAGAVAWTALEWLHRGKPSVLGMISGAVAGLGMITPASGYVAPWAGLVIGLVGGVACYWFCTWLKLKLAYDDSLEIGRAHV